MNRTAILNTADAIEQSNDFNMGDWLKCIAGHTMKANGRHFNTPTRESPILQAAKVLGIDRETAVTMFVPWNTCSTQDYATAHIPNQYEAAAMLREFVITGKVNWNAVNAPQIDTALPPFPIPGGTGAVKRTIAQRLLSYLN